MLHLFLLLSLLLPIYSYAQEPISIPLSWECPEKRESGAPFDCATELATYTLFDAVTGVIVWIGLESKHTVVQPYGEVTTYVVTATDKLGIESKKSAPLTPEISPPMAPSVFIINYGSITIQTGN